MEELKYTQAYLREEVTSEVKRYCGYAEDVHNDFIIVKESNFTVEFQSYHDSEHKDGYKYYPLRKFVTKCKDSYTIKSYPLARLAVEILTL